MVLIIIFRTSYTEACFIYIRRQMQMLQNLGTIGQASNLSLLPSPSFPTPQYVSAMI